MPARKTLYLLRRPIVDAAESLLPSASATSTSGTFSLVLLEKAILSPSPSFPGSVYILRSPSEGFTEPAVGKNISYPDLVALIDEHDRTIVL